MLNDLRYALRSLKNHPGFATVAVITLAVGIGANSAIFSVVSAVLLRPLPYPDPDGLVQVHALNRGDLWTVSPPDFVDWRRDIGVFSVMAAFHPSSFALTGSGPAVRVEGARATSALLPMLGGDPILGRVFGEEHEVLGRDRVVVLSNGLWRTRFGADSAIVGRTIMLDGESHVVVAVMGKTFDFLGDAEVWTPLAFSERDLTTQRGAHYLTVLGRLEDGATVEQAAAQLERLAAGIAERYPASNAGWGATAEGLREAIVGDVRPALAVLLGAVGLVLLIACANVANLLLVHGSKRRRELAIRAALGAARPRLIRALLTESLVLALVGGFAGLLLATWGTALIAHLELSAIPRLDGVRLDRAVLAFTALVSLTCGVVFGVLPALQASRGGDLHRSLKTGGRGLSGDAGRGRLRRGLVVAELALAVTLVIAAGLLFRSFVRLHQVEIGFDPDDVITFNVSLPDARYGEPDLAEAFFAELVERSAALPGVAAAGAVFGLPMSGFGYSISAYELDGRRIEPPEDDRLSTQIRIATPDYFRTVGMRVLRGRGFSESDRADAPRAVVINEAAAKLLWPGEDPLGHQVTVGTSLGLGRGRVGGTVVGLVGDVRDVGLASEPRPQLYVPHRQFPMDFMTVTVRPGTGAGAALVEPLRALVAALDADVPVYRVQPLEAFVAESVADRQFYLRVIGLFAAIALGLAAIGIYGVIAYGVAQRTSEIGIRLALGASRGEILGLIVGQGLGLTAVGVAIGLGAAFVATRLMEALLFGVGSTDPLTFGVAAAALGSAALLASYVPARRATRVDPMDALRGE
jgi:putative ABC transport system permease protein